VAESDETPYAEGPLPPLTPEEMRTLAYASAMGREFDFPLLVAAMGAPDEALAEQLERMTHVGVLRERPGGDRFAFVHDDVRARVYQSLTASRLRVLHRKIAEAMERLYPDPPPEVVPELGRHFFLGKVPDRSYRHNRQAAEIARQNDQPEDAAHHLERARIDLKSLPGDHSAEEAEIAEALGDLYYATGDIRSADRLYEEGLARVGTGNRRQRARLLLARAEVARDSLDGRSARNAAQMAHELFSLEGDLVGVASVHRILGRIAFHEGAYREALDEAMEALDLLQQSKDARTLGRLCIDIGNAFSMLGPDVQDEAADWYQRAIDRLGEVDDWPEVARAYLNLASLVGQSRPIEGLEHLTRGREIAERAHEPRWAGWGLAMGVEMRLQLGQVEEAERDNQQARRLLERGHDALGLQQVLANSGLISEKRGQWEDAELSYRAAIARADELLLAAEAAQANFYLARLLYKTRNLPGARTAYQRALAADLPTLNPPLAKAFRELGQQIQEGEREDGSDGSAPEHPAASS
jgi:tetratricopeptide (TPR) repeat protein